MRKGYINGKIFTGDAEDPYAQAMVTEDGIIKWTGSAGGFDRSQCDEVNDLKGKTVIPGFVDCHMHPLMLAEFSRQISCLPPKVNSIAELSEAIKTARADLRPGGWIRGWGYDEGKLAEKRSPNRYDLDKGAADVPVVMIRTCGHIMCVNSKVLEMAGIDRSTTDPDGGEIVRDENGEATGVLKENARNAVVRLMPETSDKEKVDVLVDLGRLLLSQGIVAVTDMGNFGGLEAMPYYEKAAANGFKQEVAMYYLWGDPEDGSNVSPSAETFDRGRQIRTAGLKLVGDGSVSGRTAWMEEPYLGTENDFGFPVYKDSTIDIAIRLCRENHCQLAVHAMGGRAISRVIDRVYGEDNWMNEDIPFVRVEHVTEPSEISMMKAADRNIAFVTQPIFEYCEIESYLNNLGLERTRKAYPYRDMLNKGVRVAFSTDSPATSWAVPSDPFVNIKSAVTRIAWDGTDCGKEQAVDAETAVRLYTSESAYAAGFKNLGKLRAGYKADFAVLSDDIFTADPMDIDKIRVEQTYVGGELAYQR